MKSNNYTEKEFKEFVNKFEWIFAKTYAKTAPHEYIVLKKLELNTKMNLLKLLIS